MVLIAKHMQWRCQIPRPRYISIGDISFIAKVWIFGILLLLLSEGYCSSSRIHVMRIPVWTKLLSTGGPDPQFHSWSIERRLPDASGRLGEDPDRPGLRWLLASFLYAGCRSK